MKSMVTAFNAEKHEYTMNGFVLPSVTQVIRALLGDSIWRATEWHLTRGRAIHAAAALIAKGKKFEYDLQVAGQIEACKSFFRQNKGIKVLEVEHQYFSQPYQFAGTVDVVAIIHGRETIADWKSALSPIAELQVGAYGILIPSATHGLVVALGDDGIPRQSEHFKLDRPRREFLALRSAYAVRQRLGLESATKTEGGNDGN